MHGQISLKYKGKNNFSEEDQQGGYLGLTLGEEILFLK